MSIHLERKDKGWRVKVIWYENGKQRTKSKQGFATKSQARQYGIKLENSRNKGVNIASNPVFYDYYRQWCQTYIKPRVSEITYKLYLQDIKQINSYFSNLHIKELNRTKYQQFITHYGKTHVSGSTKKINSRIRASIKSAVLDGLLANDITQGITITGNENKAYTVEYLNLKEIKQLLKYCIDNRNFNFVGYYAIITAIYTGARVSEILGLTWDDLTPEYINKTWNYKLHKFGTTKNKFSIRKISIPHELYTMLLELKSNNSNMIFETVRGIPNSKSLNKTLRATLKRLNINKQGFHFHSLRHSHVAYLISQGFDLYTISKRLGHADTTITSRTYAYLLEEHKKETDELIRRSLDKL